MAMIGNVTSENEVQVYFVVCETVEKMFNDSLLYAKKLMIKGQFITLDDNSFYAKK